MRECCKLVQKGIQDKRQLGRKSVPRGIVIRKRFFKVNNLTDLFENVKIDDILSFLKETELYQKNMTTWNWLILCKQMKSC